MVEKIYIGRKIIEVPWDTICWITSHKKKEVLVQREFTDIEEVEEDKVLLRANKILEEFQNEGKIK